MSTQHGMPSSKLVRVVMASSWQRIGPGASGNPVVTDPSLVWPGIENIGCLRATRAKGIKMPVRQARTTWTGGLQDGEGKVELLSSGLATFDVSFPHRAAAD